MTSDPHDGGIERIQSPSNRADHANTHHPEPLDAQHPEALTELLRAAASPVLSRALAGEDAAVAAFREARNNQRRPPT